MLCSAEEGLAKLAVLFRERIMNDTCTTLTINGKTDQDSDCWQVVGNEVRSAIKRIYPNDSFIDIERIESMFRALDFIFSIIWSQLCVDKILPCYVLEIQF